MDTAETRSPLQTKNPNIMVSKLRPPSAIKRPLVKDTNDDITTSKMKVPKCDLSLTASKQPVQVSLRRQTSSAIVRRTTSKADMPPPATTRTTMRRQTSRPTVAATTSRIGSAKTTIAKGTATAMTSKNAQGNSGNKRAKWDYKGRLEDMEKQVTNTQQFMNTMNQNLNRNKERIDFLESINKELEKSNEMKSQRNEESSAKIFDLESLNRSLHEEINSLKQKHEFEIEIKENKTKNLERQLKQVEGDLCVSQEETNALRSSIATMTAQSYGIRTELEATKLNLQNALTTCEQKEKNIQDQHEKIQQLERTISEKDRQLRDEETQRRKLHNTVQELKGNIRVFCRVRPPITSETSSALANFTFHDEQRVLVEQSIAAEGVNGTKKNPATYEFSFDRIFNQSSSQDAVFDEISQLVQSALDGYNVCIFAYGQTGSGKTFTMEGDHVDFEKRGMIPRSMEHVFETSTQLKEKGWKYKMEASFLEIYNETIRDLLGSDDSLKYDIKMVNNGKTSSDNEVMVTNLKVVEVVNEKQVFSLLKTATQNRAVGATKCNERSSRSHSVFILKLSGENSLTDEKCQGTLNLIDLAGSERLSHSGAEGKRLKETKNINSSLSNLSNVIMALANKESHIPYRNSKLTYLLKNSLGGNSKSLMFVNVSPREDSFQETLCSLRFATKVNQCNIGTAQKKVVK